VRVAGVQADHQPLAVVEMGDCPRPDRAATAGCSWCYE
jgi:hypothetical protein